MVITEETVLTVARVASETILRALMPYVGQDITEAEIFRIVAEYDQKFGDKFTKPH